MLSLIVALAALVISTASLYLTSLRPADVLIDHIGSTRLASTGYSSSRFGGVMAPEVSRVEFGVFVSNGGAHSGLLEAIGLIRVRWNGSKPFFDLAAQLTAYLYDSTGPAMPRVLEAGDGFPLRLQIAATDVRMDADEFARRLGEFQSLEFEVEWTFRRATPAGWSLVPRPWRRPRTTVSRAARFELDAQHFVVETLDFWGREGGPHERLAEIARSLRGLP